MAYHLRRYFSEKLKDSTYINAGLWVEYVPITNTGYEETKLTSYYCNQGVGHAHLSFVGEKEWSLQAWCGSSTWSWIKRDRHTCIIRIKIWYITVHSFDTISVNWEFFRKLLKKLIIAPSIVYTRKQQISFFGESDLLIKKSFAAETNRVSTCERIILAKLRWFLQIFISYSIW